MLFDWLPGHPSSGKGVIVIECLGLMFAVCTSCQVWGSKRSCPSSLSAHDWSCRSAMTICRPLECRTSATRLTRGVEMNDGLELGLTARWLMAAYCCRWGQKKEKNPMVETSGFMDVTWVAARCTDNTYLLNVRRFHGGSWRPVQGLFEIYGITY